MASISLAKQIHKRRIFMDPTATNIINTNDATQPEGVTPLLTLLLVMDGFKKDQPSRCWYAPGNHLSCTPFPGLNGVKTFVLAHTQGEFHVGHMGYWDGSLTFKRVQSFKTLDLLRDAYPGLFDLTGLRYDF